MRAVRLRHHAAPRVVGIRRRHAARGAGRHLIGIVVGVGRRDRVRRDELHVVERRCAEPRLEGHLRGAEDRGGVSLNYELRCASLRSTPHLHPLAVGDDVVSYHVLRVVVMARLAVWVGVRCSGIILPYCAYEHTGKS